MKNIIYIITYILTLSYPYFSQGETIDLNKLNKQVGKLLSGGKYEKAYSILIKELSINKESTTQNIHADSLHLQNNLAMIYRIRCKDFETKKTYKTILKVKEEYLELDNPEIGITLTYFASIYCKQGRKIESLLLLKCALEIFRKLDPEHNYVATILSNIAYVYHTQNNNVQALSFLMRTLEIYRKTLDPNDTKMAKTLNNIAITYKEQHKYKEAELLFTKSLILFKNSCHFWHSNIIAILVNFIDLYHRTDRNEKAIKVDDLVRKLIVRNRDSKATS